MTGAVCTKCRWLLAMHKEGGKCLPRAKPYPKPSDGTRTA